jgi:hypothetical protein
MEPLKKPAKYIISAFAPVLPCAVVLIAADQSDGFGGAVTFADGTWKKRLQKDTPAECLEFLDRAILDAGAAEALRTSLQKVELARKEIQTAIDSVPTDWWQRTGIVPDEVKEALEQRSRRLAVILDVKKWEGVDDATRGGCLL